MKRLLLFAALLVLGGAMAWAQTNATGSSSNSSNANQSTTATTPSSGQNTGTANTGATSDQGNTGAATSSTGSSADQGTAATGTQTSKKGKKAGRLPQTASPLPFLGMLGFGSMAAGMMVRKLRK